MNNKGFTLTELMVSLTILGMLFWLIYNTLSDLSRTGNNSKKIIVSQSEIAENFSIISDYIWEAEEFNLINSALLLKNKEKSKYKSQFNLIKTTEADGNRILISSLNIFNDTAYDEKAKTIYFSNTWKWTIEAFDLNLWERYVILSNRNNPTWLALSHDKLYFSEKWLHVIESVPRDILTNNYSEEERSKKIKIEAGMAWNAGFYGNELSYPNWLAFADWVLFIVDTWNNAIKALDTKTWETLILIAKKQEENADFYDLSLNHPTDIDFIKDSIILTDTNNNRIVQCKMLSRTKIDDCESLTDEDESGFSSDFSLASIAKLNHPTWIVALSPKTAYVSDSWNNVIRKIYCPFDDYELYDKENYIKTIAGNPLIYYICPWKDNLEWTSDDVKESSQRPEWWYSYANANNELLWNTDALLNLPTWVTLADASPVFVDSLNGALRVAILEYSPDDSILLKQNPIDLSWAIVTKWKMITLIKGGIDVIDLKHINQNQIGDYKSQSTVSKLIFSSPSKDLINIELVLDNEEKSNLKTSVTLRN